MVLFEDARGHVFKRNISGRAPYQPKKTWCPRCGEQVKIHKVTKDECFHMGMQRTGRAGVVRVH
jgi:hypothetical protein